MVAATTITSMQVSRETVAKLKVMSAGVPLGQYLERLLATLEGTPTPTTKQFSGMEVSMADIRTLITSRFDQLDAELSARLENLEKSIRRNLDWLIGQTSLTTSFIDQNVAHGYEKFAKMNAEHLADVVEHAREHGGRPLSVPLPYKLMRDGEVVENER